MPARDELEKRKKSWKPREMIFTAGSLGKFARLVGAAKDGAVTHGSPRACGHLAHGAERLRSARTSGRINQKLKI